MKNKDRRLHSAFVNVDHDELKHWTDLLNQNNLKLEEHDIFPNCTPFVKSVKFDDGMIADIKVVAAEDHLWSEMAVYDLNGVEHFLSDVAYSLYGVWEVGDDDDLYRVIVKSYEDEVPYYCRLGVMRDDFVGGVERSLSYGLTEEYTAKIAEAISDGVARDICETADVKGWSVGDLKLAIGRVILKALGVDV